MSSIDIAEARWPADRETVLGLFRAYLDELDVDLSFQDVAAELSSLPGKYARPKGLVLLARSGQGEAIGCVAYRPLDAGICEMKRLYIAPEWRGHGVGRLICERLLVEAREAGYRRMLLDTGDWLRPALTLYRGLGFLPILAYYHNPLPGTVYLARDI
ncbi:MAG: GNAT family N-acetyltransferase [Stellaceae bacterium]